MASNPTKDGLGALQRLRTFALHDATLNLALCLLLAFMPSTARRRRQVSVPIIEQTGQMGRGPEGNLTAASAQPRAARGPARADRLSVGAAALVLVGLMLTSRDGGVVGQP